MFLHNHDVVGKRVAQRSTCSEDSLCSGVQVADCVLFCIASAALSSLLTCGALRYPRRKSRCRNIVQVPDARLPGCQQSAVITVCCVESFHDSAHASQGTAPQSSIAKSDEPRAVTLADSEPAAEPHLPVKHSDCQQEECTIVLELHRAVSDQKVHTQEALQDALREKVCRFAQFYCQQLLRKLHFPFQEVLLQQTHDQEKLVANCQEQLADKSAQLSEQHLQQSLASEQSAAIIASLQSKVQTFHLPVAKLLPNCCCLLYLMCYSICKAPASRNSCP